jgi:hypothetical protein
VTGRHTLFQREWRLKKRMQGKSCFNFTLVEDTLFQELAALTAAGYESYHEQGFVPPPGPAGARAGW